MSTETTMATLRIDVVHAANLKPGDLYAGNIDRDAPTRPVSDFAAALTIGTVTPYTDDRTGTRMLALTDARELALTPVPASMHVIVIRGGQE